MTRNSQFFTILSMLNMSFWFGNFFYYGGLKANLMKLRRCYKGDGLAVAEDIVEEPMILQAKKTFVRQKTNRMQAA
jgi:hypothetical protein